MENCMRNAPLVYDSKCDHCKAVYNVLFPDSDGYNLCHVCWFIYHQQPHHRMISIECNFNFK